MGIRYTLLPKKPKKYKISDYTPKKIAKRDKEAAEAAARKAKKKAERKAKKAAKRRRKKALRNKLTARQKWQQFIETLESWPRIDDSADLLLTVLETFFTSFFGRFHFHVARIRIAVGSEDAAKTALLTTAISGAIEPTLYAIDRHSNLHLSQGADICVYPDFLSENIKYDVKLAFSMSLGALTWIVLKTVIPGYLGWQDIQPEARISEAVSNASGAKNGQASVTKDSIASKNNNQKQKNK